MIYELTICCPRPRSLAGDDFHVQPDKLAGVAFSWFGPDVALEVTARAVRLRATGTGHLNVEWWQGRLAAVLSTLRHDVETAGGAVTRYRLPRPIETTIRQFDQEQP